MMKDKVKAKYVNLLNEAMEKYRNVETLVRHQEVSNDDALIMSTPTVPRNEATVKANKLPKITETGNARNRVNIKKGLKMRKDKKLVYLKHFSGFID